MAIRLMIALRLNICAGGQSLFIAQARAYGRIFLQKATYY